jgi:hypothetical protein
VNTGEEENVPGLTKIYDDAFKQGVSQGEYNALIRVQYLLEAEPIAAAISSIQADMAKLTSHWQR